MDIAFGLRAVHHRGRSPFYVRLDRRVDQSPQADGGEADDHLPRAHHLFGRMSCLFGPQRPGTSGGYSPVQWAFGAQGASEADVSALDATGPEGIARTELQRLEAEKTYLDLRAREKLSKLRHTLSKPLQDFTPGDLVMFFRKWLGSKKASLEGRWRGPGRIALCEPPVN